MNWGEPLLYPKIFDMARYIRSMRQAALNHERRPLDPEIMRELMESGIERVTVSMDGMVRHTNAFEAGLTRKSRKDKPPDRFTRRIESNMAIDLNLVVFGETENEVAGLSTVERQGRPRTDPAQDRFFRPTKDPVQGTMARQPHSFVGRDRSACCVDYDGAVPGNAFEKPCVKS